ncbi:hypothetical protein L6452_15374 [Arctium lappa]|uniref:Uncharacterized protein n=1 Tax=Arctium lappa TaxID=4217 RepID=A0ACB9CNQ1_ARCLA|nr:hypothetical protein L6452_15374 [Arctium lappa]
MSDFSKKIDQLVKERDIFASKIKELEMSGSSSTQNLSLHKDGSDTYPRRRSYKKEKLVWIKKSVKNDKKNELNGKTSCVHVQKAKKNKEHNGKPDLKYSKDQLLRPVTISGTPTRTTTNISGPKYQWLPKSKTGSVLQAPQVKGGVREQWLLNITVQNPDFNVKIMALE